MSGLTMIVAALNEALKPGSISNVRRCRRQPADKLPAGDGRDIRSKARRPSLMLGWGWLAVLAVGGQATVALSDEPRSEPGSQQLLEADALRWQAKGMLDACFENGLAWRHGDVLIRVVESYDTTDLVRDDEAGVIHQVERRHRLIFDFVGGLFLYVAATETSNIQIPPLAVNADEDVVEELTLTARGVQVLANEFHGRMGLEQELVSGELKSESEKGRLLTAYRCVDPRLAGLAWIENASTYLLPNWYEQLMLDLCSHAEDFQIEYSTTDRMMVQFSMPPLPFAPWVKKGRFEIDVDRMLYLGSRDQMLMKNSDSPKTTQEMQVDWRELAASFVPTRIQMDYSIPIRTGTRTIQVPHTVLAELTWFSLNQGLVNALIEQATMTDNTWLMRMVHPGTLNKK